MPKKHVDAWVGTTPSRCDICKTSIITEFVDGCTRLGSWAIMDADCFARFGVGLGKGFGQRYVREGDVFVKVEG